MLAFWFDILQASARLNRASYSSFCIAANSDYFEVSVVTSVNCYDCYDVVRQW